MPMPYYPPVSFDSTPDQFHRRRVMPPTHGNNPDGLSLTSLAPKGHPPPVLLAPAGRRLVREQEERLEQERLEREEQEERERLEREQEERLEQERLEQERLEQERLEQEREQQEREDADSYSPPSPHLREKASSLRSASGADSSQSSPSGSPRKPAADEGLQLNVSTLARPTSSTQPNPNSPPVPLPPVQRAVNSDANSHSPPSPHVPMNIVVESMVSMTDPPQSSPSRRLASPLSPADDAPPLNFSVPPPLDVSMPLAPGSQP
ncbi:hypothetical protein BS47DRAFT_1338239 [Hydnum rufescens UP504]|uniref:Uncharacterized protein n=1 Tax=Hydnum rufescens UP504 TaxID=1448309 RepID=A0A9P6B6Q4_9AGAM|nr:hypothetical protein BS47DRAFT_1338239 [Hydnum rufescens UP504]